MFFHPEDEFLRSDLFFRTKINFIFALPQYFKHNRVETILLCPGLCLYCVPAPMAAGMVTVIGNGRGSDGDDAPAVGRTMAGGAGRICE